MLTVKLLQQGLSSLDRVERIKYGLSVLGLTTDQAGEAIKLSGHSVRMALSSEGRENVLERLEAHIEKEFRQRFG